MLWLNAFPSFLLYAILILGLGRQTSGRSSGGDSRNANTNTSPGRAKPNIVFFLVDDLGIGDIGCFGNDTIKTPNIDGLASLGAKLNHNLAPESLCTPSRAATLTGRYAIRSGMAAGREDPRVLVSLGTPGGLPTNETTFGHVLQKVGYKTGIFGKWHLGLNCKERTDNCHNPVNMGFDEFYGIPFTNVRECGKNWTSDMTQIPHPIREDYAILLIKYCVIFAMALVIVKVISTRTAIMFVFLVMFLCLLAVVLEAVLARRFLCILMRGVDVVEQPVVLDNLTVKFTNEAKDFIDRNKNRPFMLFMSYVKVHIALFTSPKYEGHSKHGHYGDNVEEMDWSVGEIVKKLQKENIFENTFIYFTSDHGPDLEGVLPSGEYHGGSKGKYKGGKSQSWEGGIRVPTVAVYPGQIPPGIVINEPTNTMDIFATVADLSGGSSPRDRFIDGKNILPLLKQHEQISPHKFMFHYCGTMIHAVRYRPRSGTVTWKAHFMAPSLVPGIDTCSYDDDVCPCFGSGVDTYDPPLLYDITNDPYEKNNVDTTLVKHQKIIEEIKEGILKHQEGIQHVPRQLMSPWWRFQLQPCCNFPFCTCSENWEQG